MGLASSAEAEAGDTGGEEDDEMRSGDSDLEDEDDSSSDDDQAWTKEVKKEHKNIQVSNFSNYYYLIFCICFIS